jgi:hypothetical protein
MPRRLISIGVGLMKGKDFRMIMFIRVQQFDPDCGFLGLFVYPSDSTDENLIRPNLIKFLELATDEKPIILVNRKRISAPQTDTRTAPRYVPDHACKADRIR